MMMMMMMMMIMGNEVYERNVVLLSHDYKCVCERGKEREREEREREEETEDTFLSAAEQSSNS